MGRSLHLRDVIARIMAVFASRKFPETAAHLVGDATNWAAALYESNPTISVDAWPCSAEPKRVLTIWLQSAWKLG